jgi:hypothetical protein
MVMSLQSNLKSNYPIQFNNKQQQAFNSSRNIANTSNTNELNNLLINSSNSILEGNDLMNSNYDQAFLIKKQRLQFQQQKLLQHQLQQNRLFKIENEIQKTHTFFIQMLNERKDSLLKELHSIVQFVQTQQIQQRAKFNSKNSPKQSDSVSDTNGSLVGTSTSNTTNLNTQNNDCLDNLFDSSEIDQSVSKNNELQLLINNYLMSIDFVTNFSNIQSAVTNTFGYLRYNSNASSNETFNENLNQMYLNNNSSNNVNNSTSNNNNNIYSNITYKPKPIGPSTSSSSSSSSPSSFSLNGFNNNLNNADLNSINGLSVFNNQFNNNNSNNNNNTEFLIEQFVNNINNGKNF